MAKSIEREVRRIENRVASAEATNRFIMGVHESQLARAEQLRKLALAVVNSKNAYDPAYISKSARNRTLARAVNNVALQRLEALLTDLPPFYMPPRTQKKKARR